MQQPNSAVDRYTDRGRATRARLLEAARDEIVAGGGGLEMAAVAGRAGVSPGLPYRYFESKSSLLVAVVESFFDHFDEVVYRPVFSEVSEDWWEREKVRIESLVDFFYEQPLAPFIISHLAGDAAVRAAQQQRIARQIRGASSNVTTGKKLGRVPDDIDAELAGALLIGGVNEAINVALVRSPRMRRTRVVNGLQTFMRNVLRVEE